MKTKPIAFLLVIASTIFTTAGQVLWKTGAMQLEMNFISIITNLPLIFGFASYGCGAVLLIIALKYGELSVLYPIIGTSYIWVTFLSFFIFSETLTALKIVGVTSIVFGLTFIGVGSRIRSKSKSESRGTVNES
ncbi:EamA/RhaT family transporter [Candidatus Woesearchaeota archaeon]|nr:EamA/RhaT family transporter [Candidatus Woesearchaeota archaeon]